MQVHTIKQTYGLEKEDTSFFFSNSVQMLNQYIEADYEELKELAVSNPRKLQDQEYLKNLNTSLENRKAFVICAVEGDIIFNGYLGETPYSEQELLDKLPDYGEGDARDDGFYMEGDLEWLVKQIDFRDYIGNEGSVYIVAFVESVLPEMRQLLLDLGMSIVLILILTAAVMTIWIYKGIINPIYKLKRATQNIRDGNLDFTIDSESDDELGELCRNFEQMRQRLKDSTEEKIYSEKENRVLISNIAHDLKTPITTVKGYAEGLIDGVADTPEKQEKYIRMIYNKANEMDRLINELTLYSKIDTNRIPYNFQSSRSASLFAANLERACLCC